ncbi:FMN reductase (NADPH)/FMN reductase [NAD(P)H] [Halanaerobium saccharolyticum]|uniref:FMN reductase (NADPH)/FMN reductase [NAD(P)H] n=1 Tax=Halanaerobium saccharolyticum TaxID=43595 RepID=A0A4R6LWJ1_9FIRM|nr:nitroreductase family protein [Halanaerobium saccharolyticum]TDO92210.1 FMN reductase (NADPH)/FMN reductase [NAD(P)H] [Halanaerobium saccharolyticum]
MNETIKLINERASLRKFADKEISQDEKDTIINSALRAPTAGNMMLYSIIVVDDQEKKNLLSKSCDQQSFIAKAPLVMVFLADYQRWYDYYNLSGVKEFCLKEDINYTGPKEGDLMLACSDALIAAQNAVIAAESLGIGSCYIGDIMENYEKQQEILSLPELVFPISMLVMGHYPEKKPVIKSRFDKKYIVFENNYRTLNKEELENMFADRSQRFNPDNTFNADNYGQFMYARKTGASFSKEMARSVRVMLKKWEN